MDSLLTSLQIVHYPHPALRLRSKPIGVIDERLHRVVRQMFDLMYAANGVGLAANQVGLPWRLFVVNPTGDREQADDEFVFINPEILNRRGNEQAEEGCLSLPELYGPVRRSAEVVIEAFDLEGQPFRMELDDFAARVVQHEYDHIDGILFTDRMTDAEREPFEDQLAAFEDAFRSAQAGGTTPSDEDLRQQLVQLEPQDAD